MNHLAHIALAGKHPAYQAGGLLADFCKGQLSGKTHLDPEFLRGVQLHRQIDAWTDTHPLVIASARWCQRPKVGGILLDLVMDHFLIRHWSDFHPGRPENLADSALTAASAYTPQLPARAEGFIERLRRHNGVMRPATLDGLHASIEATAQRLSQPRLLSGSISEATRLFDVWEEAFLDFYPQLKDYALSRIKSTAQ